MSTVPAAKAVANKIQAMRLISGGECVDCGMVHCSQTRKYDKTPTALCELGPHGWPALAAQPLNYLKRFAPRGRSIGDSTAMDTHINIKALQYTDLVRLGGLAAEAMELSRQYDQSRLQKYCKLAAACNTEVLERRRKAASLCGTALP
jgi:hypothetical protein